MRKLIAIPKVDPEERAIAALGAPADRRALLQRSIAGPADDQLQALGLKETFSLAEARLGDLHFERLDRIGAYVVAPASRKTAEQVHEALDADFLVVPDVELSLPPPEAGRKLTALAGRPPFWPPESGVAEAHRQGIRGQGVLIGVLDTGCDADHLELRRRRIDFRYVPPSSHSPMRSVRGFDVQGHGTHVCAILAGERLGIAPEAELIVASVIESETLKTTMERVIRALDWMLKRLETEPDADRPVLLNLSLGFRPESIKQPELEGLELALQRILERLDLFDVLPVGAIGNEGPGRMRVPGSFEQVMAVGAVDLQGKAWAKSGGGLAPNGATRPDVAGYGVDVLSALERTAENRSCYVRKTGTSMATPYAAGIAALYASRDQRLVGRALRDAVVAQALQLSEPRDRVGAGLARFV